MDEQMIDESKHIALLSFSDGTKYSRNAFIPLIMPPKWTSWEYLTAAWVVAHDKIDNDLSAVPWYELRSKVLMKR